MFSRTDAAVAGGVAFGVLLANLIPMEWPLWQEIAVAGLACAIAYGVTKALERSSSSEQASE